MYIKMCAKLPYNKYVYLRLTFIKIKINQLSNAIVHNAKLYVVDLGLIFQLTFCRPK